MSNQSTWERVPYKIRREIRDKEIRALYKTGNYSYDDIAHKVGVSKSTIFFAINGRWTKKAKERRQNKKRFKKLLN